MPSPSKAPEAVTDIVEMMKPKHMMRSAVSPAFTVASFAVNRLISLSGNIRHMIVPNIIIVLLKISDVLYIL